MQPVGGVQDAASAACDLLIRKAVDLVQKLLLAAPGVDQVGVRVAERREEHPARGIDDAVGIRLAEIRHAAERRNALSVGQQPGVVERVEAVHLRTAAAQAALRLDTDDPSDVFDQQFHRSRRNSTDAAMWGYITSSLSMKGTRRR